jgi:uncharacterized protein YdbL (DUF1318 family)
MYEASRRFPNLATELSSLCVSGALGTATDTDSHMGLVVKCLKDAWVTLENIPILKCWTEEDVDNLPKLPKQKDVSNEFHEKMAKDLLNVLMTIDRSAAAEVRSSQYEGSGAWLMPYSFQFLSTNDYRVNVIRRLLLHPRLIGYTDNISVEGVRCPRCKAVGKARGDRQDLSQESVMAMEDADGNEVKSIDLRFHPLSCKAISKNNISRHDACVKAMETMRLGFDRVRSEVQARQTQHRYDIVVNLGNRPMYVDFTVANPSAASYVHNGSYKDSAVALKMAEERKRNKYAPILQNEEYPVPIEQFVPFAVETNGRIGDSAYKFLEELKPFAKNKSQIAYQIGKFKRVMWQEIAKQNAMIFNAFHKNVVQVCLNDPASGSFVRD